MKTLGALSKMIAQIRIAIATLVLAATALIGAPALGSVYLQCAPFARMESGIQLFGNARDWWGQAAGRYERGNAPRIGAVMAFAPTSSMPVGHVAVVSGIVSQRELLINHANWSPVNGRRGQVERNVRVVDISPDNDWSQVRVWYAPIGDLGLRANPVTGFIYPGSDQQVQLGDQTSIAAITPDRDGTLARIVASVGI